MSPQYLGENMKVKELIEQLNEIKNKDRNIQILIGNEDIDLSGCDDFTLMHTDDSEQCVEIFCFEDEVYQI